MKRVSISIAMTTYNGAAYLREQLDSLAAQSLAPSELVVADDGSTDDTMRILQEFAFDAPFPVRIHRNPQRLGYRANFIGVAQLCVGDLISFCDQDDVWRSHNLARVAPCFTDPDVLLTFHNATVVDARRNRISAFYADPPVPPLSPRLTLPPWTFSHGFTQTFRADLLPAAALWSLMEDHYLPGEAIGHDLFFFMLASALGGIRYLDEELTEYRLHAGNTVGTGKRTRPSLLDRWRYRLEDRSGTYRHLSTIAPMGAALFARLTELEELSPVLRGHAAEATIAWHDLGTLYGDRARLCSAGPIGRVAAFARLYRRGGYGESRFWTFGAKAMAKDVALGVMLAPVLRRFGRVSTGADRACRRGQGGLRRMGSEGS